MTSRPLFSAAAPTASLVPSPCVSVGTMHAATGRCEGCLRTIDEVAHWGLFDDDEKRTVWRALALRRTQLAAGTPPAA